MDAADTNPPHDSIEPPASEPELAADPDEDAEVEGMAMGGAGLNLLDPLDLTPTDPGGHLPPTVIGRKAGESQKEFSITPPPKK